MKDVCRDCNSALGQIADEPALEDKRIVDAVFSLDLPRLQAKIRDRGSGIFRDSIDAGELQVKYRNGEPRIVTAQLEKSLLRTDLKDTRQHLINLLSKQPPPYLRNKDIRAIVDEEIMPKVNRLNSGESTAHPELGVEVTKGSGAIQFTPRITDGAAHRLLIPV